jgi:D-inositol-3-phosphate glycosyltransferase
MSLLLLSSEAGKNGFAADRHLAKALTDDGHDVTLETLPDLSLADAPQLGHQLAARWRKSPPEAVLAHGWLAGLAAQVGARTTTVPVLQRFGRLARERDDAGRVRLETAIGRAATLVLAACRDEVEDLVARGVPRARIRVVPHGVDTSRFTDEGQAWERGQRRRLVAVDDLTDDSAVASLVAALPGLPESELLVLTRDGNGEAPVVDRLTGMAEARRVGDRLHFVGPLDEEDLPALLRSADLAVAAHDESDIDFVLQAMACGVPVVAAETGALADAVADGVTGVLVPPRSPSRLAEALRTMLSDSLARESFGLAATDRARVRFELRVVAGATRRVLTEVAPDQRVFQPS